MPVHLAFILDPDLPLAPTPHTLCMGVSGMHRILRISTAIGLVMIATGCAHAQSAASPKVTSGEQGTLAQNSTPDPAATEAEIRTLITQSEARVEAEDPGGAEALVQQALTLAQAHADISPTARAMPLWALGRLRLDQGQYAAALDYGRQAFDVLQRPQVDPLLYASIAYDQARAFDGLGQHTQTERMAQVSLDLRREVLGPVAEPVADAVNLLANALTGQARHGEADFAYRQVLGVYEVLYGPDDWHVAMALSNLANSMRRSGRFEQAEPLYIQAVKIAEEQNNPVLLAQCLINYGWFLHLKGDGLAAETAFRRALDLALQLVGPDHPFTGVARANLGYALSDQGRWAEAEGPFRDGLVILENRLGADSPDLLETLVGLARVIDVLHGPESAEPLYRRARDLTREQLSAAHGDTLEASEQMAGFLIRHDRSGEALQEVRLSLDALIRVSARGRDWTGRVRGARPLFGRQVEAAWNVSEGM